MWHEKGGLNCNKFAPLKKVWQDNQPFPAQFPIFPV
nr:MAG TPA: hypothetical protein [Caudoviricetes sp.]